MASIRRYGPSMVKTEVMPRPQLGNGAEATLAAFEGAFSKVNEFIRPQVMREQTVIGENKFFEDEGTTGPEWDLVQTRGPGNVAIEAVEGRPARGGSIFNAMQAGGGPTNSAASFGAMQASGGPTNAAADWLTYSNEDAIRNQPISQRLQNSLGFLGEMGVTMDVVSGGETLERRASNSGRHLHGDSADADFYMDGRKLLPSNPEDRAILSQIVARAKANGVTGFGEGDDYMGAGRLHIGFGEPAVWGADGKGANAPEWLRSAFNSSDIGNPGVQGSTVDVPTAAEYELQQTNANSFEPRQAFTVQGQAFNAAADRVMQSRAMVALDQGIAAAQQRADGDLGKLREEMEKVRETVLNGLPDEMPGLRTSLEETFTRSAGVAESQAIDLAQRRVMARQGEAAAQAVTAIESEAQRLALTGASGQDIASHLTNSQAALAQFGPRQGFTLNGQEYPPDPSRAGTMTPSAIAQQLGNVSNSTRKVMLEAEFQRSSSPGQFVEEFRRQVMSGNSPLPAGESLDLLRQLEGRARSTESARRTEANAARALLVEQTNTRINAFVNMTEAGVPVAMPQAERAQILAALSPYPEEQRNAREQMAVADAAVVTHGMSGNELLAYVGAVRGDVQASVERGELNLEGVAVIQSLEDRVSKLQDAITAEMIGLPMIEQLAMDGATADLVDYDSLREQAAGNQDVLNQISEVEAFHRDIEAIRYLTADEREAALEVARTQLSDLAAQGEGYGAGALMTQKVVDRLEEWSDHRRDLAETDVIAFAEASGIALPSFDGAEGLGSIGQILSQRVMAVRPSTMNEGVDHPVPMSRAEIDGLTDIYRDSSRGEQMAFLSSVVAMGEDQADAVFAKIGASEPTLFAAGTVYNGGNQEAASVILRGSVDVKLEGGGALDLSSARQGALGDLLSANILQSESIAQLDAAALAYARGRAMSDGGRPIVIDDIQAGFDIALGQQADGSGGAVGTEYGATIAPKGWVGSTGLFGSRSQSIEAAIGSIDDVKLTQLARGLVTDRLGRPMDADTLLGSIEGLRPSPDDPYILVPVDADGAIFLTDSGGGEGTNGVLQFDLRELTQ
jgi:hypothetical protein